MASAKMIDGVCQQWVPLIEACKAFITAILIVTVPTPESEESLLTPSCYLNPQTPCPWSVWHRVPLRAYGPAYSSSTLVPCARGGFSLPLDSTHAGHAKASEVWGECAGSMGCSWVMTWVEVGYQFLVLQRGWSEGPRMKAYAVRFTWVA